MPYTLLVEADRACEIGALRAYAVLCVDTLLNSASSAARSCATAALSKHAASRMQMHSLVMGPSELERVPAFPRFEHRQFNGPQQDRRGHPHRTGQALRGLGGGCVAGLAYRADDALLTSACVRQRTT